MNFRILFVALLILTPFISKAQYEECGTEMTQEDLIRINNALQKTMHFKDRTPADSTVPIKFHIIRTSTGIGGIDSASVFAELDSVNSFYINAGIKFFHCGEIDYIDDTQYMNFEKQVSETICDANDEPNMLNVYFANNVFRMSNGSAVQLCGYAYSSSITKNRIIMDNDCSKNGSTLAHEIGHYFSLAHTHATNGGSELANGSNCTTAGDQLCDTPADPGLSTLTVSGTCQYTGSQTDANNQIYTPNVRNVMSYSRKSCRTEFSNGQFQRMNAFLFSFRDYLTCAPVSTKAIAQKTDIKIYPNPASSELNIRSSATIQSIFLYDQTGRFIMNQSGLNQKDLKVSVADLSSGIYFYDINTSAGRANGKLTKE